jgi:nicotinate-nucleotide pyrophosphorylase (carboxylating)
MAAAHRPEEGGALNRPLIPLSPQIVDEAVFAALAEDAAYHDVTTAALVQPEQWGRGVFVVKEAGVIAGLPVAASAMTCVDDSVSFDALARDGDRVAAGAELAEVEGVLSAILACERVALNFLQRMSGIATLTRDFVEAVSDAQTTILDTRKTTPNLRAFERYAVRAGGGHNHRYDLASGLLIKDNHIAAARQRGVTELASIVQQARRTAPHTMRIEIEVTNLHELDEALEGGADVILLDNMPLAGIAAAVERTAGRAVLEVSGGVTLDNVAAIAHTGVPFISVGMLTHSAPALDISLDVTGV